MEGGGEEGVGIGIEVDGLSLGRPGRGSVMVMVDGRSDSVLTVLGSRKTQRWTGLRWAGVGGKRWTVRYKGLVLR